MSLQSGAFSRQVPAIVVGGVATGCSSLEPQAAATNVSAANAATTVKRNGFFILGTLFMSALNSGITTELRREVTLGRFQDIAQEAGGLIRGWLSARHPRITAVVSGGERNTMVSVVLSRRGGCGAEVHGSRGYGGVGATAGG